jgi:hypothetical protein
LLSLRPTRDHGGKSIKIKIKIKIKKSVSKKASKKASKQASKKERKKEREISDCFFSSCVILIPFVKIMFHSTAVFLIGAAISTVGFPPATQPGILEKERGRKTRDGVLPEKAEFSDPQKCRSERMDDEEEEVLCRFVLGLISPRAPCGISNFAVH